MDEATVGTCVLAEAIEGAMADQAVRAVVLTGAGASAARRSSKASDNLTLINKELAKTGGGAWPPPRGT